MKPGQGRTGQEVEEARPARTPGLLRCLFRGLRRFHPRSRRSAAAPSPGRSRSGRPTAGTAGSERDLTQPSWVALPTSTGGTGSRTWQQDQAQAQLLGVRAQPPRIPLRQDRFSLKTAPVSGRAAGTRRRPRRDRRSPGRGCRASPAGRSSLALPDITRRPRRRRPEAPLKACFKCRAGRAGPPPGTSDSGQRAIAED